MRLVRILTVGGAVCVVAGGILTMLARAKGRYASQLEGVTEIDSLKGKHAGALYILFYTSVF
jgi:hypothetical protein